MSRRRGRRDDETGQQPSLFDPRPRRPWVTSHEGERVMTRVESATPSAFTAKIEAAIHRLAQTGRQFTASDVAAASGEEENGRRTGPIFLRKQREGVIRKVAEEDEGGSRRRSHGQKVAVWVGVRS